MYVELETLKDYLDISDTGDDIILEGAIERAQAAIETFTNRVFEAASDTKYYTWDAVDGLWLWLDADLHSLTSIANGDSSGTAVSTDDITLWTGDSRNVGPPYNKLRLDDGSDSTWQVDTDYYIEVTGEWGYSSTPPADIVQATVRWAAYMYQQKDAAYTRIVASTATGTVEIPEAIAGDIVALLNPYRRLSL